MIIGLSGYKQSGKDAIADELVKLGFVKIGMSDILHDCMMVLNPLVSVERGGVIRYAELVDRVGYVKAKETGEVRRLLQVFGTDVGRNMLGEDVWAEATARRIDSMSGKNIVLTGVRFENEAKAIEARGRLVRIERPGFNGDDHISEHALDGYLFECIIRNDGGLEKIPQIAAFLAAGF